MLIIILRETHCTVSEEKKKKDGSVYFMIKICDKNYVVSDSQKMRPQNAIAGGQVSCRVK